VAPEEQNKMSQKRKVRERKADSGQVRERLAFSMAMVMLWSLGLWLFLTL